MKRRWPWLLGALLAVTFLAGCITMEEEMTLNRNGSGEVIMHVAMASSLAKMGGAMGAGDENPFNEEQIKKHYEGMEGVTLKDYRTEEKDDKTHAYFTLEFDSLEHLAASEQGRTVTLTEEGGVLTYTSTMSSGGMGGMGPSGPGMMAPPTQRPTATPGAGETDPAAAGKHYDAGMAAKKAGKLDEAATELEQAIAADADHLDAHWALAWTYSSLEDNAKASREFSEVMRLAPADSEKFAEAQKALERIGAEPPAPAPELPPGSQGMEGFGDAMGQGMEEFGKGMAEAMSSMSEGGFTYIVHFPGEVLSVEGPGATKEEKTATWKLGFGDLMGAGMGDGLTMTATAKAGPALPVIPIAIGAGAVVLVLLVVMLLRRKG